MRIKPNNEYFFAKSSPLRISANAARPHTVLTLPAIAWKNLKIIKKYILVEILHKKLKIQNEINEIVINFFLPKESEKGPNIKGPKENPNKKIAIVN